MRTITAHHSTLCSDSSADACCPFCPLIGTTASLLHLQYVGTYRLVCLPALVALELESSKGEELDGSQGAGGDCVPTMFGGMSGGDITKVRCNAVLGIMT